jgi:glycosyltransferase involved in cell wall biosynthesis
MAKFPVFLSVLMVLRNVSAEIRTILTDVNATVAGLASDYELVVIDNASDDGSIEVLRALTGEEGLPNLQVYVLSKEVDFDTACSVGLESALGDFVVVIDPLTDDIGFLGEMLEYAVTGSDVVFAMNEKRPRQSFGYRVCAAIFDALHEKFNGIRLVDEVPPYRVLSRTVINFMLRHPIPSISYRHLPVTGGFSRCNLTYNAPPRLCKTKRLGESIDRGMRLLVSTTRGPMRLVTFLSLFGAVSNLVYSGYVIAVALLKNDVAPGWVTLSLQQSGMFFLISLVLLVLGEYILHMTSLRNEGPLYHVAQEFTSAVMTRREKLNIEEGRAEDRHFMSRTHPLNAA